jgi:WD40 repeat protein
MPNKDTYMTCGDDGTLRMWSISQRKMIAAINLNVDNKGILTGPNPKTKDLVDSSKLRTIDVNPSGNTVAVGSVDGTLKFVAIDQTTLKFRASFKAHDKWIGDIKFSPDNTKMATGGHDSKLKIYSISPLKLLGTSGSVAHSAVDHIDWSVDSNYLHVNTQDYELLFFKADKCQQLTSGASALKDEDYATWTAKLGWPVQGIWRSEYKGSDINCCVRSKKSFDTGYRLFAVGTDFKTIQLYRYPVLVKNSECNEFRAHGSHLTRMRFSNDDSYLLSIGGEDQCTMQWRVEPTN